MADPQDAAKKTQARRHIDHDRIFFTDGHHRRKTHQGERDLAQHVLLAHGRAVVDERVGRERHDAPALHPEQNACFPSHRVGDGDLVLVQHDAAVLRPRRPPWTEYLQRKPGQVNGDEYGHEG